MKALIPLICAMLLLPLSAQDPVRAQAAAQAMEAATRRGDLVALVEFMHPRFKERLVKRLGGEAKFRQRVAAQAEKLKIARVQVHAFTVKPASSPLVPVYFGREALFFLPSIKQISVTDDAGKVHHLEQRSYLVAISPMGKDQWSFIDGSSVTRNDLRSLFPELDPNFKTPEVATKEIQAQP